MHRINEFEHLEPDPVTGRHVGDLDFLEVGRVYVEDSRVGRFTALDVRDLAD